MARYAPPKPKSSTYITPEGEKRLKEELAYLLYEERPRVTKGVADAAAEGDRSENAEYIYGKKRLREIDKKIEFLTKRLEVLTVVLPDERKDPGKVYFGAYVRLEDEEGETIDYRIVGPDESDAERRFISMDSPVGRSLLGKREGDEVVVRRPKGDATYAILEVRYTPFGDD
ncbi:MAG: transcription elongation factor GreB [Polyangiales bacterium]